MQLKDSRLFRQQAFIAGVWCDADQGATLDVMDPCTGYRIGQVPDLSCLETRRAIAAADVAQRAWAKRTGKSRGELLEVWYHLIAENAEDLAQLLTLEQGKSLAEARGEIAYAMSYVKWFAEEAKRVHGDVLPHTREDQRMLAFRQPVGVVAAITSWNFPSALVTRKVAPALAAGCAVVLKPAEATPFSALALADLAQRAGIPDGLFNVVTGQPASIGSELTGNEMVRKLTFTGSTRTGRLLMEQSASNIKKLSLELGGNAPFIVFEDADLERAVDELMFSKFRNTGQTCICANRVLVHESVHDEFVRRLVECVSTLRVGNGFEDGVDQGPLINSAAVSKVTGLVADAVEKGATVVLGGKRLSVGENFYAPTVLTGVQRDMAIANEEIFGPVVSVIRFADEHEVLQRSNEHETGLAAYFFSRDIDRIWRMAEGLEYGIVGVNTARVSNEVAPFGGIKQSGVGREGSRYGIDEFMEMKYVCMAAN